nr:hypothetical protein CFP56_35479 [Quercus suber]
MVGLDNLWSRFSLTEEEEQGVEVEQQDEFKDILDLEKVLEFKPWMFDKSLAAFQRATSVEEVPLLDFSKSTFRVQLHNVPENSMNQATGELIGGTIGMVIQVADPKDDSTRDPTTKTKSNKRSGPTRGDEGKGGDSKASNHASPRDTEQANNGKQVLCDDSQGMGKVGKEHQAKHLDKGVVNLPISDHHMDQVSHTRAATQNSKLNLSITRSPLEVITNQIKDSPCLPRMWKKLACEAGKGRPFRFESMWLKERSCKEEVQNAWGVPTGTNSVWRFNEKILNYQDNLKEWNRKTFGHVRTSLTKKMQELKEAKENGSYITNLELIYKLRGDIQSLKNKEEAMWKQRSCND